MSELSEHGHWGILYKGHALFIHIGILSYDLDIE
jgi:hypothetical protein